MCVCECVCVEEEREREKHNKRKGPRQKKRGMEEETRKTKRVRTSRDTIEVMQHTSADAKFESDPTYAIHTYQ